MVPLFGQLIEKRRRSLAEEREAERSDVRARLRHALAVLLGGERVLVFGSLTKPGRFRKGSDVDIALEEVPRGSSPYALASRIEEIVGRSVDLVILPECRFAEKLRQDGEWWTT